MGCGASKKRKDDDAILRITSDIDKMNFAQAPATEYLDGADVNRDAKLAREWEGGEYHVQGREGKRGIAELGNTELETFNATKLQAQARAKIQQQEYKKRLEEKQAMSVHAGVVSADEEVKAARKEERERKAKEKIDADPEKAAAKIQARLRGASERKRTDGYASSCRKPLEEKLKMFEEKPPQIPIGNEIIPEEISKGHTEYAVAQRIFSWNKSGSGVDVTIRCSDGDKPVCVVDGAKLELKNPHMVIRRPAKKGKGELAAVVMKKGEKGGKSAFYIMLTRKNEKKQASVESVEDHKLYLFAKIEDSHIPLNYWYSPFQGNDEGGPLFIARRGFQTECDISMMDGSRNTVATLTKPENPLPFLGATANLMTCEDGIDPVAALCFLSTIEELQSHEGY